MFINKTTFHQWLDEYTVKKSNELQNSLTGHPKRDERITLDITYSRSEPLLINMPFKYIKFERAYRIPGFEPQGDFPARIKIFFDENTTGNAKNFIYLNVGETIKLEHVTSKCFISWDYQLNPCLYAELAFSMDVKFSSNAKYVTLDNSVVNIAGDVTAYLNPNTKIFARDLGGEDIVVLSAIAGASINYECPSDKWAKLAFQIYVPKGVEGSSEEGNSVEIQYDTATAYLCNGLVKDDFYDTFYIDMFPSGTEISMITTGTAFVNLTAQQFEKEI